MPCTEMGPECRWWRCSLVVEGPRAHHLVHQVQRLHVLLPDQPLQLPAAQVRVKVSTNRHKSLRMLHHLHPPHCFLQHKQTQPCYTPTPPTLLPAAQTDTTMLHHLHHLHPPHCFLQHKQTAAQCRRGGDSPHLRLVCALAVRLDFLVCVFAEGTHAVPATQKRINSSRGQQHENAQCAGRVCSESTPKMICLVLYNGSCPFEPVSERQLCRCVSCTHRLMSREALDLRRFASTIVSSSAAPGSSAFSASCAACTTSSMLCKTAKPQHCKKQHVSLQNCSICLPPPPSQNHSTCHLLLLASLPVVLFVFVVGKVQLLRNLNTICQQKTPAFVKASIPLQQPAKCLPR